MLSFVVLLLLLRFALRELKNQYYFPVAAALLSCKFYHFPQLQFTKGDQSWALQDEGRGWRKRWLKPINSLVWNDHLEWWGFCCHLQDKVKCISMYYSIEISFGVLYCRVEYSQYDSVFFVCVTWGWVNQARISPFDTVVTSQTVLLYTVPWAKNPSFCLCSFVPPL